MESTFREMIANTHILKKGIKTTELLAAAHYKVFGPLYRTYLFSWKFLNALI